MSLGHCGCAAEQHPALGAIGSLDTSRGFVTLGGSQLGTAQSTGSGIALDLGIGAAAFVAPIIYDRMAPKRWPHTKKLWQDVVVVVGLYFLGNYVVRKVI